MVNVDDSKFQSLQDLWRAIAQDPDTQSGAFKDNFPLEIPSEIKDRAMLAARLSDLFIGGVRRVSSRPKNNGNVSYPMPGVPDGFVHMGDVEILREGVLKLMPDPADEQYAEALSDRIAGVIILLAKLVNLQATGQDTGALVRNMGQLTRAKYDKEGNKTDLDDMPWTERREILRPRARSIDHVIRSTEFRLRIVELSEAYRLINRLEEFQRIVNAFDEGLVTRSRISSEDAAVSLKVACIKILESVFKKLNTQDQQSQKSGLDLIDQTVLALNGVNSMESLQEALNNLSPTTTK